MKIFNPNDMDATVKTRNSKTVGRMTEKQIKRKVGEKGHFAVRFFGTPDPNIIYHL